MSAASGPQPPLATSVAATAPPSLAPAVADPARHRRRPRPLRALAVLEDVVAGTMLALLVVIVLIQLASRWVEFSAPWTEELSRVLLIWIAFLGAAIVLRENEHIVLDLLYTRLPARVRAWIDVLVLVIVAAIVVVVVLVSWAAVRESAGRVLPASGLPRSLLEAAPCVAGVLMLLHLAEHVLSGRFRPPVSR